MLPLFLAASFSLPELVHLRLIVADRRLRRSKHVSVKIELHGILTTKLY